MQTVLELYGLPPKICSDAKYTADFFNDLKSFVFGQGGGKSRDIHDAAAGVMANWPNVPDKDGKKYHTVNDITYSVFCKLAKKAGIEPTPDNFYGMTEEQAGSIAGVYFSEYVYVYRKQTNSQGLLALFFYTIWGSGTAQYTLKKFQKYFGVSVFDYEKKYGSVEAIDAYSFVRYLNLKAINESKYKGRYVGWYSGISNFWRVFRNYV